MLDRGAERPVTLVQGPAGSGKTLLIASWIRDSMFPGPAVWVTAERDEPDATQLWSDIADGLRASVQGAGAKALEQLVPAPSGAGGEFARLLGDALGQLSDPVLLVLDDFHHVKLDQARKGLGALLARPPPQLRLILIMRGDRQLQLHRLRLSGELTEIRPSDLAFTAAETGELMTAAGVNLSPDSVVSLRQRTEGLAAGLRLAAISFAASPDPEHLAAQFSGAERTMADFLTSEVLDRQRPDVRRFMRATCLVERVNGSLANALVDRSDGDSVLRELESANAFVTSMDLGRSWFRYHPLLADVLRAELRREAPDQIQVLHRTAARWHAGHGFAVEAIRNAQAGEDWDEARNLLIEHWFTLFLDGRQLTIRGLMAKMPLELARADAELAVLVAADHLAAGRLVDADAHLALAARLAASVPQQRRARFDVVLAVVSLIRARNRGDFEAAVEGARAILAPIDGERWHLLVSDEDLRALALMNLGLVEFWALHLEDSERHLRESLALARRIGRPHICLGCLGPLAHVANMTDRPGLGDGLSREAIELAERLGWSDDPTVGVAYLALGGGLVSAGRLEEGDRWLGRAERVLHGRPDPEASVSLPFSRGALRFAQQRYDQAIDCFREAEAPVGSFRAPHFLSTSATTWRLRALIRLGDTGPAQRALAEAGDAARQVVEWCNLAAHLHLAEGDREAALEALAPVLDGSAAVFHSNLEVEARLLEAVTRQRLGDTTRADDALERALDVAEPRGHVWIFLTVPEVCSLLARHSRDRNGHGAFVTALLDGFAEAENAAPRRFVEQPDESLTPRELAVLRLLPTHLSAAEIAREMSVSVHTVKTHMRHLYAKLGVHRRSEAITRARALGMLGSFRAVGKGAALTRFV
jgi:LuxR family maltose regulon positive regulatory protein